MVRNGLEEAVTRACELWHSTEQRLYIHIKDRTVEACYQQDSRTENKENHYKLQSMEAVNMTGSLGISVSAGTLGKTS